MIPPLMWNGNGKPTVISWSQHTGSNLCRIHDQTLASINAISVSQNTRDLVKSDTLSFKGIPPQIPKSSRNHRRSHTLDTMDLIALAIPFFILALLVEMAWDSHKRTGYYRANDAMNSLSAGILSTTVGYFTKLFPAFVWIFVFDNFA